MVMTFRNPFLPVHQLRDEMDRLLTGLLGQTPEWTLPGVRPAQPAVNVWEDADKIMLEAELPGLKSQQVDISVAGDELTLKVQRPDVEQEGVQYHRRDARSVRSCASCGCRPRWTPPPSAPSCTTAC